MRRTTLIAAAVVLLAAGALFASNMGFKINYNLAATTDPVLPEGGNSASGTNTIALPYNAQSGITDAQTLITDIGSGNVQNFSRWRPGSDGYETVAPGGGTFPLLAGEGYFVRMKATLGKDYIMVGSHDPSWTVPLYGTGQTIGAGPDSSQSGSNSFAPPYHATATDAQQLAVDIGSTSVQNISRWKEANDGFETYAPTPGGTGFSITPGEWYFVRIKSGITVNYTPSHY